MASWRIIITVLVLCQGGNCRSVAVGYLLKYVSKKKYDPIAASLEKNSKETLQMLSEWADRIIIVQKEFVRHIPVEFRKKLVIIDIGPDRWFNSLHPELLKLAGDLLDKNPTLAPSKLKDLIREEL